MASLSPEQRVRIALIDMLWIAVADEAECTCVPKDRCSHCCAMTALGLGRWTGAPGAMGKLTAAKQQIYAAAGVPDPLDAVLQRASKARRR